MNPIRLPAKLAVLLILISRAGATETRVLPAGQFPQDHRLEPLKDLDGYFPFHVPKSPDAWRQRAERLRQKVWVAAGLWPIPERTPLHPQIFGRTERDGFTVEKVALESYPGHFVTGLLFRPTAGSNQAKRPAVLTPHGHGGRLQDHGVEGIQKLIAAGEERFEESGRFPALARCGQLARMGCVTFIYDMVGYADSVQITNEVGHRLSEPRPAMDQPDRWGFFGVQAELRLQSIFGLQTWNSLRALDFLASLPDVDDRRIAVTGDSGGGTQTIFVCALDPRPIVAFPQGMVSTSMQGGCPCENASLLRIGTGNVELTALFAPKPQGMTAADDWTKEMLTKGFPELKQLYQMLGKPEHVMCESLVHFPHNYNYVTRAVMYHWLNRHLNLGLAEPIVEGDFPLLSEAERTVWDAEHPRPEGGDEYERSLTTLMDQMAQRQLQAVQPRDAASLATYKKVVGGAYRAIVDRTVPAAGTIERDKVDKREQATHWFFLDRVRLPAAREELPVVSWYPRQTDWNGRVVIWIDGHGKQALIDQTGMPHPAIEKLLAHGYSVVSADCMGQGEFTADGKSVSQSSRVGNPRQIPAYTFGYNDTLLVQRVHDILTLIGYVRHHERPVRAVDLVGTQGAGPWVALARSIAGRDVDRLLLDTQGFRFTQLQSVHDVQFLPGALKYGDLPGILALSSPYRTCLLGERGTLPDPVRAAYAAAEAQDAIDSLPVEQPSYVDIASWLTK